MRRASLPNATHVKRDALMSEIPVARLLNAHDAAAWLNVSRLRLYSLANQGLVPGVVRLGRQLRFDREALERFISEGGRALPGGWRKESDADANVGADDAPGGRRGV